MMLGDIITQAEDRSTLPHAIQIINTFGHFYSVLLNWMKSVFMPSQDRLTGQHMNVDFQECESTSTFQMPENYYTKKLSSNNLWNLMIS